MKKKIIIDTDAGIDDAQAIVLALNNDEQVEVVAITTCHGNVDVDLVNKNVQRVLKEAGKPGVPVYSGAARSLVGGRISSSFYHGNDGLGDVPEDVPTEAEVQPEHAVHALIRIVNDNPGEITLICIAPLTNVALAIRLDPEFGRKLEHCVIMGGNYRGVGNITVSAEFNFHADPEAARVVLRELDSRRTTIITWELCTDYSFDWEWYKLFAETDTPLGRFFKKIELKSLAEYYSEKDLDRQYITCDQLAVAVVVDPELVTADEKVTCTVELAGEVTRGQMIVDWENREKREKNIQLVKRIDFERYKRLLRTIVDNNNSNNTIIKNGANEH